MRASLADSLDYISDTVGRRLGLAGSDTRAGTDAIRTHRVAPVVFGLYYKLVLAVRAGAHDQAAALFTRLLRRAETAPAFNVGLYDEASLGDDRPLYGDLIDPAPGAAPWLCPPPAPDGFQQRVHDSLDLIATADPALAAELRGLVVQVVGAVPSDHPEARPFGSASSFMLWGLVIVNMQRYQSAAALVTGLVHEAAHLLLFAHSIEGPLVTNAIEDRFTSPLRSDPRPMDGVFHATFVAARLHWAHRKLREAGSLAVSPDELPEFRRLYFGGMQTIADHAKLTPSGRRILAETRDYMQDA